MSSLHHEKVEESVKHLASEFLVRESNNKSLITVTNIVLSPDEKRATIYLSVLPESEEESVLSFAKRKRADMREYIRERLRSRVIPFLDVEIDKGEKHRQRIEVLIAEDKKRSH